MKRKAKFDLGMPIPQKTQRAQEIVNALTDNVSFPAPVPALNTVQAAIDELTAAYQAALDRSLSAKALQRTKNEALNDNLRPLRDYVNEVAQGDEDLVLSSGFEASKIPSPVGPMPQVEDVKGQGGKGDGSILLRWKSIYGAKNYVVEMSEDGVVYTPHSYPTKANDTIADLEIGKFYHFRVAANGAAGLGGYSDSYKALAS